MARAKPQPKSERPAIDAAVANAHAIRAAFIAERARRSGSKSFFAFVQQGWQYVPRCNPYEPNWHMKVVCDHLEEMAYGRMPELVINIPPGHAKSVFGAVLFPAWVWTWWPKCQMLFFSYSDGFVRRDSDRCREVILSDWYQETYCKPGGWNLRTDLGGVTEFQNTLGGERVATSIGGKGGGLRAHIIVGDDPLNITDAHSEAARNEANNFVGQVISQRWVDKRDKRFALIMQRLHEDDPSGVILAAKTAAHLRLPAEYDPQDRARTFHYVRKPDSPELVKEEFWADPRGEDPLPADVDPVLLFPARFPRSTIEADKKPGTGLGPDGFEAQGNQRPTSYSGGMLRRIDWRFYRTPISTKANVTALELRPRGCTDEAAAILPWQWDRTIITVDAAFKANPGGSRVSIQCWGQAGPNRFLRGRHTDLLDFTATKAALIAMANRFPEATIYVEDAANGPAIMSDLKQVLPKMIAVGVSQYGSKPARAAAGQPWQRAHNCFLPEGDPGMHEFVATCAGFPKGKLADDVDSWSLAMIKLDEADPDSGAETGRVTWGRR